MKPAPALHKLGSCKLHAREYYSGKKRAFASDYLLLLGYREQLNDLSSLVFSVFHTG